MDGFRDKVAVVTGAASGIGLALARRLAEEGMKVLLADIEEKPLAAAEGAIRAAGGTAMALRADVMQEADVAKLADAAFKAWGNVHVLCNNAGVSGSIAPDGIWSVPAEDWNWVLGVNFSGVLYGIRHFVPRMLANGEPGHIVNTASVAGLVTPLSGPYTVAKHGVVALSEMLYKDLKARHAKVSASVLCPGWVDTRILDSARNRPAHFAPAATPAPSPEAQLRREAIRDRVKKGIAPEKIAELVVGAIRSDTFYVVPVQPDIEQALALRLEDIRLRRNPTLLPPA